ncbi:response regulator [Candidatus Saccharibacteria bacterium]|nr:response regulator [Candidatus Saccharibacteria bacterium]
MNDQPNNTTAKILIIEDDRFIGEMYTRSLRSAGYQVDWSVDGQQGLAAAIAGQYDLILLDIMLPHKTGNTILRELRTPEDKIPNTRVIVMTNFEQDEDARAIMEADANAYLIKADITPRRMLEVIAQVLA